MGKAVCQKSMLLTGQTMGKMDQLMHIIPNSNIKYSEIATLEVLLLNNK
jgi:hypothetical protein